MSVRKQAVSRPVEQLLHEVHLRVVGIPVSPDSEEWMIVRDILHYSHHGRHPSFPPGMWTQFIRAVREEVEFPPQGVPYETDRFLEEELAALP